MKNAAGRIKAQSEPANALNPKCALVVLNNLTLITASFPSRHILSAHKLSNRLAFFARSYITGHP